MSATPRRKRPYQSQQMNQAEEETNKKIVKIVNAFTALCADKNQCLNGKINEVMETGSIKVGGESVMLPDINPFKYLNLQSIKIKLSKLQASEQRKISWSRVTSDRIEKLIKIADCLDDTPEGFLRAIEHCMIYYLSDTEIAFLLYASGLLGMCIWDGFTAFPLISNWDDEDGIMHEKINMVIPMPLPKWSLFNMFIKILNANVDTYQQQQQQQQVAQRTDTRPTVWSFINTYLGFTATNATKISPSRSISIRSNYLYNASAFDSYTMSYYDHDNLTANCVLSTLLEAAYLQDHMKVDPGKIFLRMQHPPSNKAVQWRSLLSLGDEGSMATHFGTTFQASDKKLHDLRLFKNLTCTREKIPYKDNELYIAMTVLYIIIGSFKSTLLENKEKLKQSRDYDVYKVRTAYIFYHLRVLLENRLSANPVSVSTIYEDYMDDINREFTLKKIFEIEDLLQEWNPTVRTVAWVKVKGGLPK